MAKKRKKVSGGVIELDFTNVKDGGRVRVPEGDYKVKIASIKQETSSSGNPMLVVEFEGLEGKLKGKTVYDRFVLQPKNLWSLRNMLQACGKSVPKKVVKLNYKKLVDVELGVTLTDDEYEGRIGSVVSDYLDLETLESGGVDDEDEFEEDDVDAEDEDEDEEDEDDEDEDDDDELEDVDDDEL